MTERKERVRWKEENFVAFQVIIMLKNRESERERRESERERRERESERRERKL